MNGGSGKGNHGLKRRILAIALPLAVAFVVGAWHPGPGRAHEAGDEVFEKVGVDEKLGAQLPLELALTDQAGKQISVSRYFTGGPVILTLNYYSCPTLCPLVFRNLAGTIGRMKNLQPGIDFRVVTVSIDPQETPKRAAEKSAQTYAMIPSAKDPATAWPFLRGDGTTIAKLAQSVGVRYTRLADGEFAHPNVIVIVTPKGRVSRYLYGLEQDPQDLRLALIEASGGTVGGSKLLNKGLLYCFHYDPAGRKYVLLASRVMTGAMVGLLTLTAGLLALLWRRETR